MSDEHFYCGAPWRVPHEESVGLYPGLVVDDARMAGAITLGATRLPLYTVLGTWVQCGWEEVQDTWEPDASESDVFGFLTDLLEQRGEFARLLLVLANAKPTRRGDKDWWERPVVRRRVLDQLRRCVAALEAEESQSGVCTHDYREG